MRNRGEGEGRRETLLFSLTIKKEVNVKISAYLNIIKTLKSWRVIESDRDVNWNVMEIINTMWDEHFFFRIDHFLKKKT